MVILGAAPYEIHCVAVCGSNLHILAAVEETVAILSRDMKVDGFDSGLAGLCLLSGGDVHKFPLMWRTSERAEKRMKIVSTRGAGRY
jgi:hypothetical protein